MVLKSFLTGAAAYPLLELLYRGRTHYSMALAGGVSVCLIRAVSRMRSSLLVKAVLCGGGITAVELLFGLIWNRTYAVWDYRHLPLNFQGQICIRFSLLWCVLSAGVLLVDQRIKRKLAGL